MASLDIGSLRVSDVTGQDVCLDPLIGQDSATVLDLRDVVASSLGLHPRQCVLFVQGEELLDEQSVNDVLRLEGAVSAGVCVVKEPCWIRPHQYNDYVDCEATGCLPVDQINLRWAPLDFGDDYNGRGFNHDYQSVQKAKPVKGHGVKYVTFPEPSGIKVNMMPFVMGNKESLPAELHHYWAIIEACNLPQEEHGKVGYLTIHESVVPKGASQRRRGLHIEAPGFLAKASSFVEQRYNWGCGLLHRDGSHVKGGIYMASNVADSCRFWNVKIKDVQAAAGHLGDMEHMREVLGEGSTMEANRLYWLTDATPHEALPLEAETSRQFFRLVTSELSAWYPEHSTANDLVLPDAAVTKIIPGSKFGE